MPNSTDQVFAQWTPTAYFLLLTFGRCLNMAINYNFIRQQRMRAANKRSFGENFLTLPEGEGKWLIRILPPRPDANGVPWASARVHHLGDSNVYCPKVIGDKGYYIGNCPVCDH